MWILMQSNRLLNMDKVETIDLASRRENTAGTLVYEIVARTGAVGQGTAHILARLEEDQTGPHLFHQIKLALLNNVVLFDIPDAISKITG